MNTYCKKLIRVSIATIVLATSSGFFTTLVADTKPYLDDLKVYKTLVEHILIELDSDKLLDIDSIAAMQIKLINLGRNACRDYGVIKPNDSKFMNLVSNSAEAMREMSLQDIHNLWHKNTFLIEQGIDIKKLDSSSITRSLMDTVVHPTTAYIALNKYKQTHDQKYLGQVRVELMKSLDHLKTIK